MVIAVTIPYKMPSLNDYILKERIPRRGRFIAAAMKDEWTEKCSGQFIDLPPCSHRIHVTCRWREGAKRRDPDNIAFAKKFILDGMKKAQFIPNDNSDVVIDLKDEFVYGKDGKYWVEVYVEEDLDSPIVHKGNRKNSDG